MGAARTSSDFSPSQNEEENASPDEVYASLYKEFISAYGTPPSELNEWTHAQFDAFGRHLSTHYYKQNIMIAKLCAMVGNALGGKGKKKDSKPDPDFEAFNPLDFLEPWMLPPGAKQGGAKSLGITEDTAKAFMRLYDTNKLPEWVVQTAPLTTIARIAGREE